MTDNSIWTLATAALLHDIGKLFQRAGVRYDYNLKVVLGYAHAAVTKKFFNGINKNYMSLLERFPLLHGEKIADLASMHHNPKTPLEKIIAVADRLAAGFERQDKDDPEYQKLVEVEESEASFKNTLQRNIFYDVHHKEDNSDSFYSLEPFSPDLLPASNPLDNEKAADEAYKTLADGLLKDLCFLSDKAGKEYSLPNIYGALCSILERYCWCVPSATSDKINGKWQSVPCTISLYDHGLSVSAVACALYSYHNSNNTLDITSIENGSGEEFCLIQGDFSGIQDFIFDRGGQSNKYAAKILRAKSFFVSAATQAAASELCDELSIPYAAIVLNAGGKFTIITGNTGKEKEAVNKLRKKINSSFRELSFGQTKFNIACCTFSQSDFTSDNFGTLMRRMGNLLGREKLTHDIKEHVFADYLTSSHGKEVCTICGEHWADKGEEICTHCRDFQEIGTKLVKAKLISFSNEKGDFKLFEGKYFSFGEDKNGITFDISRNDTFNGYAKRRISGYIPQDGFQPLTFEDIAKKATGASNLAILKADVDGLGNIFSKGIRNSSISKTAALSRMLDYFFTGWLQNRIDGKNIYTVFAGGDDLFLIGAWNEITDLAGEIAEHLKKYSGFNRDVHISAGIILRKSSVPVREMAHDAEKALEKAKKGDSEKDNRDRINIFDITVKWEKYRSLMEYTKMLRSLYGGEDAASRGFMYRLLGFAENADLLERRANGKCRADEIASWLEAAKWQARFRYLVSRNYGKSNNREQIESLGDMISQYQLSAKIPLSVVIYENRKSGRI